MRGFQEQMFVRGIRKFPTEDTTVVCRAVFIRRPVHHPMGGGQELRGFENHLHAVLVIVQLRGTSRVTVQHEYVHADIIPSLVVVEVVKFFEILMTAFTILRGSRDASQRFHRPAMMFLFAKSFVDAFLPSFFKGDTGFLYRRHIISRGQEKFFSPSLL